METSEKQIIVVISAFFIFFKMLFLLKAYCRNIRATETSALL